jgi:hypothetical protein
VTTPHQLPETFFTACANVTGGPRDQNMAVDVFVLYTSPPPFAIYSVTDGS